MREYLENLELNTLSPLAVYSKHSLGRQYSEEPGLTRTCFQRDRDRIIHSKTFRRLKDKTQVFSSSNSDHIRSRLTHTIEVAQISRHLARLFRVNEDLTESIALAHDLGHTPYGHSGEDELNDCMKDDGGFEHNKQSRRIVEELEQKYPQFPGLNLSLEVRDGLLKHRTPWDQPEQSLGYTTIEAQITNIADEIAYNNHDLDDGLREQILQESHLNQNVTLWSEAKNHINNSYSNLKPHELHHLINSYIITQQIADVFNHSNLIIERLNIKNHTDLKSTSKPIISFSTEMTIKNNQMRRYLYQNFYQHDTITRMNQDGKAVIRHLFNTFVSDPELLPEKYKTKLSQNQSLKRIIADYIAGMTDTFANELSQSLIAS